MKLSSHRSHFSLKWIDFECKNSLNNGNGGVKLTVAQWIFAFVWIGIHLIWNFAMDSNFSQWIPRFSPHWPTESQLVWCEWFFMHHYSFDSEILLMWLCLKCDQTLTVYLHIYWDSRVTLFITLLSKSLDAIEPY